MALSCLKKNGQKLRDQDKFPSPEFERMVACHIINKELKEDIKVEEMKNEGVNLEEAEAKDS